MLTFLGWVLSGSIVGALAKLLMPGRDPDGIIVTIALGIVGAIIGGFVGQSLGLDQAAEGTGYIMATLGAIVVLFVYRQLSRVRV